MYSMDCLVGVVHMLVFPGCAYDEMMECLPCVKYCLYTYIYIYIYICVCVCVCVCVWVCVCGCVCVFCAFVGLDNTVY